MAKTHKILFIINELIPGGASQLVADIAGQLSKRPDYSVGILTFRPSHDSAIYRLIREIPSIKLFDLSGRSWLNPALWLSVRKIIKEYDLVHANLFPGGYLAAVSSAFTGKPVVYTEHSTHNRRRNKRWLRPLEQWVYSRFRSIIAISPSTSQELCAWLRRRKLRDKTTVIYNGVNLRRFHWNDNPSDCETLYGRTGKPILMVSRFTESKDHASLIKAIPYLHDKDAYVAFAGDGATMEAMKELSRSCKVTDRVLFLGARSDIPALMQSAVVGVQASNWEGFGLTAIEMMASGLPVVASDVPGLRDVVDGAGMLFEKGNEKALAKCLNLIIGHCDIHEDLRKKGEERALQYDIETTIAAHDALYKKYLNV